MGERIWVRVVSDGEVFSLFCFYIGTYDVLRTKSENVSACVHVCVGGGFNYTVAFPTLNPFSTNLIPSADAKLFALRGLARIVCVCVLYRALTIRL